jgi:hypothetical protein
MFPLDFSTDPVYREKHNTLLKSKTLNVPLGFYVPMQKNLISSQLALVHGVLLLGDISSPYLLPTTLWS